MIETLWFCLVAIMIAGYVVLDGFDLGAGIIHLFVARTDEERRQVLRSIGPVWDGNEVWLLAGRRDAVLRVSRALCGGLQRILSGADDGAMAADSARHLHRVAQPHRKPAVEAVLGFACSAGRARCWHCSMAPRSGQRGARRSAGFERLFSFCRLWTKFPPGPNAGIVDWYTLLVGASFVRRAGRSWLLLGGAENERRFAGTDRDLLGPRSGGPWLRSPP